jgi:Ca2+:H+ antiporter
MYTSNTNERSSPSAGSLPDTEDNDNQSYGTRNHSQRVGFLQAVKSVQSLQRAEKLRKQRSARSVNSSNSRNNSASSPNNNNNNNSNKLSWDRNTAEQTPLMPIASMALDRDADRDDNGPPPSIGETLRTIAFGKGIVSLCLLAMPLGWYSHYASWGSTWIFWLNFFTMIPLASILGDFTEEVALHTNQTIGGLINATFGNAVEVVVAIQALLANEIRVVQASMIGSIFSNLLLVLGCCFFFGGLGHQQQRFNSVAATANMGLLALSSIALILPTPFAAYYELHDAHVLTVSRIAACFLMCMYLQLLFFQLKTHANLFAGTQDDSELAVMPFWVSIVGLLFTTLVITIFSDYLVESIDGFVTDSGISRTFVGIILLPIVGNAVEHVTAVTVAMKDKMDLAMGVAVGSCTQISLFVVPLTVLVGWALERDMTLNFPPFEVILFVMSVLTVAIVLGNPECNWLEGSLLITTYLLIAVGFWFEDVKPF